MKVLAWFEVAVGVAIAALWVLLLATGQVPEIAAGNRDIWFHLGAELLAAMLLLAGGVTLLRRVSGGGALAALALGALLYTTVNSAGYYADLGEWAVVGMFLALAAVTAGFAIAYVRRVAGSPTSHGAAVAPRPASPCDAPSRAGRPLVSAHRSIRDDERLGG